MHNSHSYPSNSLGIARILLVGKKAFRLARSGARKITATVNHVVLRVGSYWGRYYCRICGCRVRAFLPLPSYYADNLRKYGWPYPLGQGETCNYQSYSCPFCGASDRDRLYALYIQDYLAQVRPGRITSIVDFAPSVPLSQFIQKQIVSSGQDISYRTADLNAVNVDDKVDITNMKIYADGQFDFFICSHVLEHVVNDRKALSELYRILKPMGQGILMVPIVLGVDKIDEDLFTADDAERWRRFGQNDHVRLYSKSGFIDRVSEAGFRICQYGSEHFSEETFTRNAISKQSVLYIVRKQGEF